MKDCSRHGQVAGDKRKKYQNIQKKKTNDFRVVDCVDLVFFFVSLFRLFGSSSRRRRRRRRRRDFRFSAFLFLFFFFSFPRSFLFCCFIKALRFAQPPRSDRIRASVAIRCSFVSLLLLLLLLSVGLSSVGTSWFHRWTTPLFRERPLSGRPDRWGRGGAEKQKTVE